MKKMFLLRDFLLGESLNIEPDNLLIFSEEGTTESYPGSENENFRMHYEVVIIVTDYNDDTNKLLYLLMRWLDVNQPFIAGGELISFRADINAHDSVDIEIRVELNETILVEVTAAGVTLTNDSEPALEPVDVPIPVELIIEEDVAEHE